MKQKILRIVVWYVPFAVTIAIVYSNMLYESRHAATRNIHYLPVKDYRTIMWWDSIKILHDANATYENPTETNLKIKAQSVIRKVEPIVIRQDSILLLTLSEDSVLVPNKSKTIRCFYIGPLDTTVISLGKRITAYGYRMRPINDSSIIMKADFVDRYSVFTELSKIGLSGIQILGLMIVLGSVSLIMVLNKLVRS